MKKIALTLFIPFFFCNVYCQNFTGCIEIDFEEIPNQTPQEGLPINNQYLGSHGITFELEDGTSPVLAQVGGVTTAFGSAWGNDQPAPGFDIGSFFLTDDGSLSGLQMIPVIVRFQMPVDSFSACVLDIDFEEFFIIQARDQNDNIILADTIFDGDPGTGDGVPTCWGFNFDGCEGSVYSVRFEGFRSTPGAFGLGMDNFSFCFAGIDIANEIRIQTQDLTCDEVTGSVILTNIGDGDFVYSIDGVNFQSSPIFDGLMVGTYTIYVRDETGCEAEFEVEINDYIPLEITNIALEHTSCGDEDGSIQVFTTFTTGVIYTIDGENFQSSPVFNDVPAGTYNVFVFDQFNCFSTQQVTINPSSPLVLDALVVTDDFCNDGQGSLLAQGSGGTGQLTYTLNGTMATTTGLFESLAANNYIIQLTDEQGCILEEGVILPGGLELTPGNVQTQDLNCHQPTGSVTMINVGEGDFLYSLDNVNFQSEPLFEDLLVGNYTIYITDPNDCETELDFDINDFIPLEITNINSENTTCGDDNGSIQITTTYTEGVTYTINGMDFQGSPSFNSVLPGTYTVIIVDQDNCGDMQAVTIDPSTAPVIDNIVSEDDVCNNSLGSLSVQGSGGTGELIFSINGMSASSTGLFDSLPASVYAIQLTDEVGCLALEEVTIEGGVPLIIENILSINPDCDQANGQINVLASGGSGDLYYLLNGQQFQLQGIYTSLAPDEYIATVMDTNGCEDTASINLPLPICPIFIPNIFSPDYDGHNDRFQIFTNSKYDVKVLKYQIFDRWGELVYEDEGFTILTSIREWWDGVFRDQPATQGVYVYVIEVEHNNGKKQVFAGDVTLIR